MTYSFLVILILFLIIYILFYALNQTVLHKKEHFLTYYLPFYNVDSNLLDNFYENHNYNKNYFKHKIDFNEVVFASTEYAFVFNVIISRIIINKTLSYQINSVKIFDRIRALDLLYENKINLTIVNLLLISYYNYKNRNKLNNMYVITNLYKSYLLCMTKLKYNIHSLDNMPYQTKIGILDAEDSMYFYIHKFLRDLNYNKGDMILKIYDTVEDLHAGLKNDEIQVCIYGLSLPSARLNDFINYDFERDIVIIPFQLQSKLQESFLAKNSFFDLDTYDLNKISSNYLPKKFGNYYYFTYKPDMPILSYQHYLITNNKINDETIKNITTLFLENINIINSILPEKFKIERIGPRPNISRYLQYHHTTIQLLEKYGYVSNDDNPNCQYLVGVKKCDKKSLQNNGFLTEKE